jgi:hypothetical protein
MAEQPIAPFNFIKVAEPYQEDHELFNPDVEATIAKLGLPYNMAMAVRISQANLTEERKQFYVDQMVEQQKEVIKEQEELCRRFMEASNDIDEKNKYEAELAKAQTEGNVILSDKPPLN